MYNYLRLWTSTWTPRYAPPNLVTINKAKWSFFNNYTKEKNTNQCVDDDSNNSSQNAYNEHDEPTSQLLSAYVLQFVIERYKNIIGVSRKIQNSELSSRATHTTESLKLIILNMRS